MVFIFPTELEAQPFRLAYPHASIVICGVGMAECAAAVAAIIVDMKMGHREPQRLILCGIAGTYDPADVAIGEVVEVVSEKIYALPERFAELYTVSPTTSLRPVSSNSVTAAELTAPHGVQIENMEGASFCALCQQAQVPYTQVRAISNVVGDKFENWEVNRALTQLAIHLGELL